MWLETFFGKTQNFAEASPRHQQPCYEWSCVPEYPNMIADQITPTAGESDGDQNLTKVDK